MPSKARLHILFREHAQRSLHGAAVHALSARESESCLPAVAQVAAPPGARQAPSTLPLGIPKLFCFIQGINCRFFTAIGKWEASTGLPSDRAMDDVAAALCHLDEQGPQGCGPPQKTAKEHIATICLMLHVMLIDLFPLRAAKKQVYDGGWGHAVRAQACSEVEFLEDCCCHWRSPLFHRARSLVCCCS